MAVTLINLIQYDGDIMNNFPIPETADRTRLVNTMIMEYGTYDIFPDNPTVFKVMNKAWWERNLWTFQKMLDTMVFEYDPIENYRRYEDGWENNDDTESRKRGIERESSRDRNENRTRTENTTRNTSQDDTENTVTDSTADSTSTASVSAYNVESFSNTDKTVANGTGNENVTTTRNNKGKDDLTGTIGDDVGEIEKKNETENENENVTNNREKKYGILAHGNIGVTTTQQMIQQERDISDFDVYRFMADKWARDFCILVS